MIPDAKTFRQEVRGRLMALCSTLPGTDWSWTPHLNFRVHGRTFAYHFENYRLWGRSALCCKAMPGELERLTKRNPRRYFVPEYLGRIGWVGAWLGDETLPRWDDIEGLFREACLLARPLPFLEAVGAGRAATAPDAGRRVRFTVLR